MDSIIYKNIRKSDIYLEYSKNVVFFGKFKYSIFYVKIEYSYTFHNEDIPEGMTVMKMTKTKSKKKSKHRLDRKKVKELEKSGILLGLTYVDGLI